MLTCVLNEQNHLITVIH